ncbi:MAG: bifunctional 4-hydroxy-2-oxoglutarate aldolase/2-dehydro-3-deoxy-phosphogluconate aldolase [Burkholderiales bacterium]|nr:bifunctional 4-hydroxy-2-oxoglutarate aldolase/2-dehydro-3-deoxy-phosphogluconate aldolase [Burkholderiales bacterium]
MNISDIMAMGPVIPVIVIEEPDCAVPLARALAAGGVRVLEITLRTPAGLQAIRAIRSEVDGVVVGAGTVLNAGDLERSVAAGAEFIVSPGTTATLLAEVSACGLPFLPGVANASNVMSALDAGFDRMKLFPAEQAGGIGMLRALAGPFPMVRFCPTGGIGAANAREFLAQPNVPCVGGSWIAPADIVRARDWGRITELAKAASALTGG